MPKNPYPEVSFGYNHLEVGHPYNLKPYRVCGARTRSEDAVSAYCQRQAGWGTSHKNEGRCSYHGGRSQVGEEHHNWTGGRYAHIWRGRLAQHIKATLEDNTNPLDLLPELEVSRIVLTMALDRMLGGGKATDTRKDKNKSAALGLNADNVTVTTNTDGGVGDFLNNGYPADISDGQFFENPKVEVDMKDLELVRACTQDVINSATKIITARNQTALTKAETVFILAIMKDAITRFVPKENQEAFVRYLMERVPTGETPTIEAEVPVGSDS